MERFGSSSNADIEKFIGMWKNDNTVKQTKKWINCYRLWAKCRNKAEDIEVLDPVELDNVLQYFYADVKKQNGDDFEPNSLCSMQAGIDRYLREKKYGYFKWIRIRFVERSFGGESKNIKTNG